MARTTQRGLVLERRCRGLLADFKRSGMSVRAFCAVRGISEASLYSWRSELARRDQRVSKSATPTFVPVTIVASAAIEVVLPTGVIVRVPAGADDATALRLINALTSHAGVASC